MTASTDDPHPGSARRLLSTRVRVPGARLHAWTHPGPAHSTEPPVVLVHGLGVSGRYLLPLARELAALRPVHVPELPGHGRSTRARSPLDVPALAAALLGWMDTAGVGQAVLVGQSMGCQVVLELAARHPARVRGLVLVAPTPDPGTRTVPRAFLRLLADVPRERIALVPVVAADYLLAGPRLILAEYRAMRGHRLEEAMRAVREVGMPCAVVRGEHDPVVGAAWAAHVARQCGAPPPVTVTGAGHAVQHSAPRAVSAVVRDVLRDVVRENEPAGARTMTGG